MPDWKQNLYFKVPWFVKEWLVGLEAIRRNSYRRYGDYSQAKIEYSLMPYYQLQFKELKAKQFESLKMFLKNARQRSTFYKSRIPEKIETFETFERIPILTKTELRQQMPSLIAGEYPKRHLWRGSTSGSTGTPFSYYVGREGIRARFAIQDNYFEQFNCHYGERRARIGGSKIAPADQLEPPFWIFNKIDNQLQMSPYHMDSTTLPLYIDKLTEFNPAYMTGYAHAVYTMGRYLCEHGGFEGNLKAIFIDSEGVPPHYIPVIEEGFKTRAYENYGLAEVGMCAVQCINKKNHILELTHILEIVDDDGVPLPDGESGRIIITDLTQHAIPYLRYDTGDIGTVMHEVCDCGQQTRILSNIDGRSDEAVITPAGRRVGRLSYVTKPGKGIAESQIAQVAADQVVIRVVPATDFDETSMKDVLETAYQLLGSDMKISWEIVEHIPRTNRHKFKHVVREF